MKDIPKLRIAQCDEWAVKDLGRIGGRSLDV
jgi:hypothetical protein